MTAALQRDLLFAPMLRHKGRLALSVGAIALGVALGYAVQLINAVAIDEMAQAAQVLAGDADLMVMGPRAGFDESLYPVFAARPEVAVASPVVEIELRLRGRRDPLKAIGIDIFRAAQLQPMFALAEGTGAAFDSLDYLRPDRLFLSGAAAGALEVNPGDIVHVQVGLGSQPLRVAGLLPGAAFRQRLAVMDIAAAQTAAGRLGRVNRLDLRLRPGADASQFMIEMKALLPPGVWIEPPQAGADRLASLSRSYRVNLNVLALVALFTGGLLVFSTQSLAVVRRRSQLALLRVLGVTRGGIVRQVLAESLVLGMAGAALGLAAGYLLASEILARFGADLGAGHFRGLVPAVRFEPAWATLFFLLGVAVTLAGSIVAAIEAGRTQPAQALKAGDEQRAFERLAPAWPGLALVAAGAALTQAPPIAELPLLGYLAIALLLVGTILLMPRLARVLFRSLPGVRNVPVLLATQQIAGAPGQTMVSLASIVASVSLMVSMAIMVASFRGSLDEWLDQVLPADLYLRTGPGNDTAFLSREQQVRVAALPGLRRVEFLRNQRVLLRPERPLVQIIARDFDSIAVEKTVPLQASAPRPANAPPPAWITEGVADLHGLKSGQIVEIPLEGRTARFFVAGVWRDYARQQGAILIERATYAALTGDGRANEAALWLAPGATAAVVSKAIRALPGGSGLDIALPGEIRALSLGIFDRTFAVTYGLEAAAVMLGLFGLSAGFGALVLARRREFGMLRHLGMTRGQVGAMLAAEGAMVSALGLAVGLVLGWVISLVLIHVVNRQSFHWSMEVHMPWLALAQFALAMFALAILTAVASGRQAMGGDAVRAVKEDW